MPKPISLSNFSPYPSSRSFMRLFGRCDVHEAETSTTPGSVIAAA
jgi:hypothetical protein